jgi:hypothetical protein
VDNQVRLQLFALAYNLGNFLRCLALPKSVKKWSLRTLREKLVKIGAKVVKHSRYVVFQMAEVAVPQTLFREILGRIRQLRFLAVSGAWMMRVTAENLVRERRAAVAVCPNNRRKQVLEAIAGPFWCFCAAARVETAGILLRLR